jgi:hypothetical protein
MIKTTTLKNQQLSDLKTNDLLLELEYQEIKKSLDCVDYKIYSCTRDAILNYAKKLCESQFFCFYYHISLRI